MTPPGQKAEVPMLVPFKFDPQRLHHANCGYFGGRVNAGQHARNHTAHGRGGDDVGALTMRLEVRQARCDTVVDGREIDCDRVVPLFGLGQACLLEGFRSRHC